MTLTRHKHRSLRILTSPLGRIRHLPSSSLTARNLKQDIQPSGQLLKKHSHNEFGDRHCFQYKLRARLFGLSSSIMVGTSQLHKFNHDKAEDNPRHETLRIAIDCIDAQLRSSASTSTYGIDANETEPLASRPRDAGLVGTGLPGPPL